MPHAVTHVLIPIILLSLFRDFAVKNKKKFPLHYVLIGGLAGLLPDLDVAAFYIMGFFGYTFNSVHRMFTHNLFLVLLFVLFGFLFYKSNLRGKGLGRHHLQWHMIFFVIAFGVFVHILLDSIFLGAISPFYPFYDWQFGLNLISYIPVHWQETIAPSIDAALLVAWLVYMEIKHKISDFI